MELLQYVVDIQQEREKCIQEIFSSVKKSCNSFLGMQNTKENIDRLRQTLPNAIICVDDIPIGNVDSIGIELNESNLNNSENVYNSFPSQVLPPSVEIEIDLNEIQVDMFNALISAMNGGRSNENLS